MYVIEAQSGVNSFKQCTLGQGKTEEEAWLDALGPKPWSDYTKKVKKTYSCRKLEEGEEVRYSYDD
jgi:hypothetical protein